MAKVKVEMPEEFLRKLSLLGSKTDEIAGRVLEAGGEVVLAKVRSNLSSVIGSGTAELIEGAEKLDALSALMRHMAGREDTFTEEQARGVAVLAIRVRSLSAKAKKH
mgnify:CR=1 FL=1